MFIYTHVPVGINMDHIDAEVTKSYEAIKNDENSSDEMIMFVKVLMEHIENKRSFILDPLDGKYKELLFEIKRQHPI